jgi:hypothetical protein
MREGGGRAPLWAALSLSFLFALAARGAEPAGGQASPLGHAPLEYFAAKGARCHGPYGSFYGEEFGRKRSDAGLRQVVREMAEGPAGAPLVGRELDAQVAFHRALLAKEPFLAWTAQSETGVAGEVSPDSTVTARLNDRETSAQLVDTRWRVALPSGARASDVTVVACSGASSTTLALRDASFSHGAPRR